ncbi:MAG: hypothetical protein ACT4QB_15425 [Gammaproteobacteria bacterium]
MSLPPWIAELRRTEVIERVHADGRTSPDRPLGIEKRRIQSDAICGGQADFDAPWESLSGGDRALLYCYYNQLGHLEELAAAFQMLFGTVRTMDDPFVLDLGAGPCTAGLALAGILGNAARFTYIGVERAASMSRLGERLAVAAAARMTAVERHWYESISTIRWPKPPSWRPVIVVVSYLLASPTVRANELVAELDAFVSKVGRGAVTVLYTNSPLAGPNRAFPAFRDALATAGFSLFADDLGGIMVNRYTGPQMRNLRYALFHRKARTILPLGRA